MVMSQFPSSAVWVLRIATHWNHPDLSLLMCPAGTSIRDVRRSCTSKMNDEMRVMTGRGIAAAPAFAAITAFPLLLAGCYSPHVVNSQDTRYCESQGFRPGT